MSASRILVTLLAVGLTLAGPGVAAGCAALGECPLRERPVEKAETCHGDAAEAPQPTAGLAEDCCCDEASTAAVAGRQAPISWLAQSDVTLSGIDPLGLGVRAATRQFLDVVDGRARAAPLRLLHCTLLL